MITIIHGDDIKNSRNYFLECKTNSRNPTTFDGEKITVTDLVQSIEGGELFFDEKQIFIENFLSKRKIGKEINEIVEFLNKNQSSIKLFFWENKEITKKMLSLFPKADIKIFKFPQKLFIFLDSIKPGNGNELIKIFHEALKNIEPELLFYMINRQLRLLLSLIDNSENDEIEELKKMAPWQRKKLQSQAKLFSIEKLTALYKNLYTIDLNQKTGKSAVSLTKALDFFLLEI